ncbi:MAG: hypothetical protein ABW043_06420 [Devosia sp.]|uniref:hypothetical protein n=1 Tax=Devosia sp. TaxID=1871048 RepID=UPI003395CFF1
MPFRNRRASGAAASGGIQPSAPTTSEFISAIVNAHPGGMTSYDFGTRLEDSRSITVIADTRFGGGQTVSEAGPKIFSVPIALNKWRDGYVEAEKRRLPHMGFAFAGNTFAGQTAIP